jgi:hypothetical protein
LVGILLGQVELYASIADCTMFDSKSGVMCRPSVRNAFYRAGMQASTLGHYYMQRRSSHSAILLRLSRNPPRNAACTIPALGLPLSITARKHRRMPKPVPRARHTISAANG